MHHSLVYNNKLKNDSNDKNNNIKVECPLNSNNGEYSRNYLSLNSHKEVKNVMCLKFTAFHQV